MPVYSYRCECCGHEFDTRQSFSDENLTQCPNCDEGCLRRVYKPARVVFKGSGFYVTDNKSSLRSTRQAKDEDKKEKSESKPDSDKKSEPKKKEKPPTPKASKKEPK